jgi:hypothetical protein
VLDAVSTIAVTFSAADSLTLLLTAESLLFAAFGIVLLIVRPAAGGANVPPNVAWAVAILVGAVLAFVSIGAALAWWQLFVDAWPCSALRGIQAIAAAAGIVVQPMAVSVLCWATKP